MNQNEHGRGWSTNLVRRLSTLGGETEFVKLGIKVVPKPGMMVLWPNTKNEDSLQKDERTSHQACRVKKGHKYAANLWVHLYDFMTPHLMGCSEGG